MHTCVRVHTCVYAHRHTAQVAHTRVQMIRCAWAHRALEHAQLVHMHVPDALCVHSHMYAALEHAQLAHTCNMPTRVQEALEHIHKRM